MEIIITNNANLVVERLGYTKVFFSSWGISILGIINADDIAINVERFIYEIQIRPGIWDLANWHKFGVNGIWH